MRTNPKRVTSSRRVRQRGALLFTAPLLMLLVVLLSAMALDGARLYSLREKMQTQVDAAATAAADADQTCGGQNVSLDTMKDRALTAAQAQGFSGTAVDLNVQAGVLESPQKGKDLAFRTTTFLDQSNAVRVAYSKTVRISQLLPSSWLGGVTLSVNAAVRKQAIATLSAAGSTADINGGLLGALLGAVLKPSNPTAYNLDVTDPSSLQNTTVELGDLLDKLGVNNVAALLPLSGSKLAGALSQIASQKGLTGVASALDDLVNAAGVNTVKVSDVLKVVGNTSVPSNSQFPLYDALVSLVLNLAEVDQQQSGGLLSLPLSVSGLSLGLGSTLSLASITGLDAQLHVGRPPTVVIGPARRGSGGDWVTRFYAPDITLQLKAQVQLPTVNLGLIDLSVGSLDVPLAVNVGGGYGDFTAARCAQGSVNSAAITVQLHREIARIATGTVDGSTGALQAQDLDTKIGTIKLLFGLFPVVNPAIHLAATLDTSIPGTDQTVTVAPNYPLYCSSTTGCSTKSSPDSGGGLSGLDLNLQIRSLSILNLNLDTSLANTIANDLRDILNATVKVLADSVIDPLLKQLGVGLGGISVSVTNVSQNSIQIIENVPLTSQSG